MAARRERIILIDKRTGEVQYIGLACTRRNPCPICGKPDWCTYDPERGKAACCRDTSGKKISDEAGYLFTYREGMSPQTITRRELVVQAEPEIDAEGFAKDFQEEVGDKADILGAELGVTAASLHRLELGWCKWAYTFPMKNETERVIGIRTRDKEGRKYCMRGSRNGMFIPRGMHGQGPLVVVEGPTDCAAMLDLGYDSMGRPNATACVDMILTYLRLQARPVVIIGNNDEAKTRRDGSVFWPGQEGTQILADKLVGSVPYLHVIMPLEGKDARAWVKAGATRAIVDTVIRNANPWRKGTRLVPDLPRTPEPVMEDIEW